ncbi:uncharacterized protein LOC124118485 [Haliotis rufescens]|uniref:uncharacterized protein LOC124118485 n=1 Tax=Haliotis rufescens TaxID=6454 RepID=UPI00201F21AC|nr:uncharacterized protein LOC124118485 [Haliotis rufescens]
MEGCRLARHRKKAVLVIVVLFIVSVFETKIPAYISGLVFGRGLFDFSHLEDLVDLIQPVPLQKVRFDVLLKDYTRKIQALQAHGLWKKTAVKSCEEEEDHPGKACVESSCPRPRPTTPEDNLRSVLSTMSDLNHKHLSLMLGLFPEPPTGKRVMFATAASDNHFNESQGLIQNLHQNVFPLISNYTFVYYDLGLLPWQRKKLMRDCRCELRRFPVELMPPRLQDLQCYAWKSFIIQANLPKTDILVWVDSSVRFWNKTMPQLLDDVERRGIVTYADVHSVAQHTLMETMIYMKEDVCTLAPVAEDHGGFLLLHNERWIREAVIKPLVACAMSPKCMCPRNPMDVIICDTGIHKYNKCHRFDQSAINIILSKLFRDHKSSFYSPFNEYPNVTLAR